MYFCVPCIWARNQLSTNINFVAELTGLRPYEAAKQLAVQYGLQEGIPPSPEIQLKKRKLAEAQQLRNRERLCFSVLSDFRWLLIRWKGKYAPKNPEEEWDGCFVEACQKLEQVEYQLDLLLEGAQEEKALLMDELLRSGKIAEPLYCWMFLRKHPMRYIGDTFFNEDGTVTDVALLKQEICSDISGWVTSKLANKVNDLWNAMKMLAASNEIPIHTDRIHVANGTLYLDGRFVEKKHAQSFHDQLYVRFLCFGNGVLTALHDRSDGFFRRQIILTTKDKLFIR